MHTKILRDDGSTGLRLVQLDKESSLSMARFIYTQLPYKYKVIQYKTKHTYMVGIVIPLSNQSDWFPSISNNIMAVIWDLGTIQKHSVSGDIFRVAPVVVATLGKLVESAMFTLPPAFCGPVRTPHLKRQSQYKIYEWMALLHWYLVPMAIKLGFHPNVIENFADFVWCIEFAMTSIPRTE